MSRDAYIITALEVVSNDLMTYILLHREPKYFYWYESDSDEFDDDLDYKRDEWFKNLLPESYEPHTVFQKGTWETQRSHDMYEHKLTMDISEVHEISIVKWVEWR